MKKINKKNQIRKRFSTLLLCCLAIVLCKAPRGWAVDLSDGKEHNVTTADLDYLSIWSDTTVNTIVNLYDSPVANSSISGIYAGPGSILNIYSGSVDWYIAISPDEPYAVVTVYGTKFAVNSQPVSHGQVVIKGKGELTGTYGNGYPINLPFYCPVDVNVPIKLQPPSSKELEIDIKPGSELNKINLKSKGVIPVAVLTTGDFDAIDVDPATVVLAGAKPVRWTMEDVDDDGDEDILFHFRTQELNLDEDSTEAAAEATKATETTLTLTCNKRTDLKVIQGTDKVCIVSGKK